MFNVRLAGCHLYGKQLFTWLSLVVSFMAYFVLSFFPLDVLDGIWESVSEGFLTYFCRRWDQSVNHKNTRAPAETTSAKKKIPNTGTAPTETNEIHGNPAFDVEALTAKITKQETDSVLASLQDSGLLPRRPGTSDAEKESTKNGDQSSEINAQSQSHEKAR